MSHQPPSSERQGISLRGATEDEPDVGPVTAFWVLHRNAVVVYHEDEPAQGLTMEEAATHVLTEDEVSFLGGRALGLNTRAMREEGWLYTDDYNFANGHGEKLAENIVVSLRASAGIDPGLKTRMANEYLTLSMQGFTAETEALRLKAEELAGLAESVDVSQMETTELNPRDLPGGGATGKPRRRKPKE